MAHIRTKAELDALTLTPAEEKLIDACQKGEFCVLGDGTLPAEGPPDPQRHIHANVLRYLILGGCENCRTDDIGVWVSGAHVTETLDLDFTTARGAIRILNSRFVKRFDCEQTKCRQLDLDGSDLQGIRGHGLEVTGNIFLIGITTHATIKINSAIIGGQLDCSDAKFKVTKNNALNAQGAKITESVFLKNITTHATIRVNGATIGGQLNCKDAKFEMTKGNALNAQGAKIAASVSLENTTTHATVRVNSATVGGQLDCSNANFKMNKGDAFFAQSAKVIGGIIWRDITITTGRLNFTAAQFNVLADDEQSWPNNTVIEFDGMTYDRIVNAATDAKTRLRWLEKGHNSDKEFEPQPYTQLAKVLRDMGHDKDARLVLEKREELIRQDERKRFRAPPEPTDRNYITALVYDALGFLHWAIVEKAFKYLIGYGHRPFRSLGWLFALWATAVSLSHMTWSTGDFAPTSAVLQSSTEWQSLAKQDGINPAEEWSIRKTLPDGTRTYAAGQDWSTFSSFAYAADLVIPIINLGQTDTWGPSTERGAWGKRLWRYGFMLQIAGWIITALGAAAITGLIRRD